MLNYSSVVQQLLAYGLVLRDELDTSGRIVRCRVDGERERRGWYVLHEVYTDKGQLLVGAYGINRGNDHGTRKIEIEQDALSREQHAQVCKCLVDDRKRLDQQRKVTADKAAHLAEKAWSLCLSEDPMGTHDYLKRKGVQAHGLRYTPKGALVVPMQDMSGAIRGLQFILSRSVHKDKIQRMGRDKDFWPAGLEKKGSFFLIGLPTNVAILCEGYATGASQHEATGLPVVVAFDAGNMPVVAGLMAKRYKGVKWIVAADDDDMQKCRHCKHPVRVSDGAVCPSCGAEHQAKNAGVEAASLAALALGGYVAIPKFSDESARWMAFAERGIKTTDFNDLHIAEGLHVVRRQIESHIRARQWEQRLQSQTPDTTQGGEGSPLKPLGHLGELLERYALIYGHGGAVFDHQEHIIVPLSDMRDLCVRRELHRAWMEHEQRAIVRVNEVGFDPSGKDADIRCNLWSGWPSEAKEGDCSKLLELLYHMCSNEERCGGKPTIELFNFVLRWLTYPIQNPGAKMRTSIVVHGPQGTGKNLFFESVMRIYGQYGRVIDQSAIEDKFNDWASKKLFLIADEVIARSELFHIKNKLKGLITGEWVRINPKNVQAYDEKNHVNMVFLSNERVPVVLDEDDRRYCVIWTPEKLTPEFYLEVAQEINQGGIEALHYHLLKLPMDGFNEHSKPPVTEAKSTLIELSLDSVGSFMKSYHDGDFGLQNIPALVDDLFSFYQRWCSVTGFRPTNIKHFGDAIVRKHNLKRGRERYYRGQSMTNPLTFAGPPDEQYWMPQQGTRADYFTQNVRVTRNLMNDWLSTRGLQNALMD